MLSKKDFIARAKLIAQIKNPDDEKRVYYLSVQEFKKSNPKFDETKFRDFIDKENIKIKDTIEKSINRQRKKYI